MFGTKTQTASTYHQSINPSKLHTMSDDLAGGQISRSVTQPRQPQQSNLSSASNSLYAQNATTPPQQPATHSPFLSSPAAQQPTTSQDIQPRQRSVQPIESISPSTTPTPITKTTSPFGTPSPQKTSPYPVGGTQSSNPEVREQLKQFNKERENFLNKQHTSGGLNQTQTPVNPQDADAFWNQIDPSFMDTPISQQPQYANSKTSTTRSTEPSTPNTIRKVILSTLAIFFVISAAAGGYYWSQQEVSPLVAIQKLLPKNTSSKQTIVTQQIPETPPAQTPTTSTQTLQPNTINTITLSGNTKENFKLKFQDIVTSAKKLPEGSVTGLSFQDANLQNLSREQLIEFLDITLHPSIIEEIQHVNIFLHSQNNDVSMGIAFDVYNRERFQQNLFDKEHTLVFDIGDIYLERISIPQEIIFANASYKNYAVRFFNITSKHSIDYTYRRNALILGTSSETLHALLDYLDR